jgi:hypothetical protein
MAMAMAMASPVVCVDLRVASSPAPTRGGRIPRFAIVCAGKVDGGEEVEMKKKEEQGKGMFSFVTDNESSRGAIQLPNTPAQDGNLGQMISVQLPPFSTHLSVSGNDDDGISLVI